MIVELDFLRDEVGMKLLILLESEKHQKEICWSDWDLNCLMVKKNQLDDEEEIFLLKRHDCIPTIFSELEMENECDYYYCYCFSLIQLLLLLLEQVF